MRREDERIDYEELASLAREHRPGLIIAGASAYSREIDFERFARVAEETGAVLMADVAHVAGLIIAGLHVSPVPHAAFVTSHAPDLRGPRMAASSVPSGTRRRIATEAPWACRAGRSKHVIPEALAFAEAWDPEFTHSSAVGSSEREALARSCGPRVPNRPPAGPKPLMSSVVAAGLFRQGS